MDETEDDQSTTTKSTRSSSNNNNNNNNNENETKSQSAPAGVQSGRVSSGARRQQQQQHQHHRDYTPEQRRQLLKRALEDVVTYGISVRLAAESHGVAKSSLSDYIRKQNVPLPARLGSAGLSQQHARQRPRPSSQLPPSPLTPGAESEDAEAAASSSSAAAGASISIGSWSLASLPTLVPWQPPPPPVREATAESVPEFSRRSELLGNGCRVARVAHQRDYDSCANDEDDYRGACGMTTSAASVAATAASRAAAELSHQLCEFINRSPSPFHAVAESKRMLEAAGFSQLREDQPWSVQPNQRAYVTRNGSTIFAFAVGGRWKPGNGFSIVGAHTDSPCLRLKPVSHRDGAGDLQQCGVETYGGGLWYTWFDRDLTAAGRVIVRTSDAATGTTVRLSERLVNLEAPIFKVPSLAIHLDRTANDGFAPNKESHLAPILCQKVLDAAAAATAPRHPPALLARVADVLGCQPGDIADWELCLADTQPARLCGLASEFVSAPRLDNLLSCFGALTALIEAPGLEADTNCRVVCLYDHEEVGSQSAQGADSALTLHFLGRLCAGASFEEAVPKSMLVSADVAHAVHPNYEEKHERRHRPTLFGGLVVKANSNQRYASNARTGVLLRECLRRADPAAAPLQDFVIRQDAVCGSTIGPILAARVGLPTVDVGAPVLGMHSCRETAAAVSPGQCAQLFAAFFQHFPAMRDAMRE